MSKKLKTMKTIVTHSGSFHADESLAVFMLRQLSEYKDSKIIRTRDPLVIEEADIVVDVGAVYDASRNRYDHHQRGFTETFNSKYDIKLSSAGLVYKHFGKRVLAEILNWPVEKPELTFVYEKVYDKLILMFDGVDNGVEQYPTHIEPKYQDSTSISNRVGRLNPVWNEVATDEDRLKKFEIAVQLTGEELVSTAKNIAFSWMPARKIVEEAMNDRFSVHPSGRIILLARYCPWQSHLDSLESELKLSGEKLPLYVVFQDTSDGWRLQAVAKSPGSFETRKPLPEPWRGVRDDALSELTNVPECIFVHAAGFIGGTKTKESTLKLATLALQF